MPVCFVLADIVVYIRGRVTFMFHSEARDSALSAALPSVLSFSDKVYELNKLSALIMVMWLSIILTESFLVKSMSR